MQSLFIILHRSLTHILLQNVFCQGYKIVSREHTKGFSSLNKHICPTTKNAEWLKCQSFICDQ